jgi:hypothetical protein
MTRCVINCDAISTDATMLRLQMRFDTCAVRWTRALSEVCRAVHLVRAPSRDT